jgi:hypothetical protein
LEKFEKSLCSRFDNDYACWIDRLLHRELIKPWPKNFSIHERIQFLRIKMSPSPKKTQLSQNHIISQALRNLDEKIKTLSNENDTLKWENHHLRFTNTILELNNLILQLDHDSLERTIIFLVSKYIDKPQLSQEIHTLPKENNFQKKNRHEQSSTMQIVVIVLFAFLLVYFDSPLQVSAELFDPVPSTHMKTQFLFINQTYLFIPSIILVGIFFHRIKTFLMKNIAVWATILIVMFFLSLSIYVVTELSDLLERFIFSYLWPHLEVAVFFPDKYLIQCM